MNLLATLSFSLIYYLILNNIKVNYLNFKQPKILLNFEQIYIYVHSCE